MARTLSHMLPLGTQAPSFTLYDTVSHKMLSLDADAEILGTVIMFICNHCPFVQHVNAELVHLAHDYMPRKIRFLAISSNDAEAYPDDAPEKMTQAAQALHYPFPYLYDPDQEVARACQAACTPDFYLFDSALQLVYRGQLDDARPGNDIPPSGASLRLALDALLQGKPISADQKPSLGCNIKWKNAHA